MMNRVERFNELMKLRKKDLAGMIVDSESGDKVTITALEHKRLYQVDAHHCHVVDKARVLEDMNIRAMDAIIVLVNNVNKNHDNRI